MGAFQCLGENYQAVGFPSVEDFVKSMESGVGAHLDILIEFIQANHLDTALENHDWHKFARGYNGKLYAERGYHLKLEASWKAAGGR